MRFTPVARCYYIIVGPLPLDQWEYLLHLFRGDFHSRQGIKQTADSLVPIMACLFTLCHAQMSHIFSSKRAGTGASGVQIKGKKQFAVSAEQREKLPHFRNKISQKKGISCSFLLTICCIVLKISFVKNRHTLLSPACP